MLGFVSFDINQPSLSTPFHSAPGVCFCLYGPFNCISFVKFSFSPDMIPCGSLDSKRQLTDLLTFFRCPLIFSRSTLFAIFVAVPAFLSAFVFVCQSVFDECPKLIIIHERLKKKVH